MSGELAFMRSWSVGKYTATLTCPKPRKGENQSAVIEWSPSTPTELTPAEAIQYMAGRNAALGEMAQALGISVTVIG